MHREKISFSKIPTKYINKGFRSPILLPVLEPLTLTVLLTVLEPVTEIVPVPELILEPKPEPDEVQYLGTRKFRDQHSHSD